MRIGIADQEVIVGIRPEGFVLDENGPMQCIPTNVEVMGRDVSIVSTNEASLNPQIRSIINADNKVCPDITRWREFVHAPDIEAACAEGWEPFIGMGRAAAGNDKLLTAFWPTGLFEQCHFLMGFEDTLANFYEHPDEMHELIDYITDYLGGVVGDEYANPYGQGRIVAVPEAPAQ